MHLKNSLLTLLFLSPSLLFSQYQVFMSSEKNEKPITKGFYYTLPQREIELEITYTKTTYHSGIYSEFAEKLLGISSNFNNNSPLYQITSCQLKYNTLPDPTQIFYVSNKKGNLSTQLSPQGCLLDVNGLYTPSNKLNLNNAIAYQNNNSSPKSSKPQFADLNLYEKFDTVYQNIQIDTITVVKKIIKSNQVEKSEFQKAEEIAKSLINCRENRLTLISGIQEVNYAPQTLQYMCEELQKMETEYLNTFLGTSETQEYKVIYKFTPSPDSTSLNFPIYSFSSKTGITPNPHRDDPNLIHIQVNNINTEKPINFEKQNIFTVASNGFYFRISAWVNILVTYNDKVLLQETSQMPQWGNTQCLPASPSIIKLSGETGDLIYYESK